MLNDYEIWCNPFPLAIFVSVSLLHSVSFLSFHIYIVCIPLSLDCLPCSHEKPITTCGIFIVSIAEIKVPLIVPPMVSATSLCLDIQKSVWENNSYCPPSNCTIITTIIVTINTCGITVSQSINIKYQLYIEWWWEYDV